MRIPRSTPGFPAFPPFPRRTSPRTKIGTQTNLSSCPSVENQPVTDKATPATPNVLFEAEMIGFSRYRAETSPLVANTANRLRAAWKPLLRETPSAGWGVIVLSPADDRLTVEGLAFQLSQSLNAPGPMLGTADAREAFLSAFAWLDAGALPGVWLLVAGAAENDPVTSLAIGLQPVSNENQKQSRFRLLEQRPKPIADRISWKQLAEDLADGQVRHWPLGTLGTLQIG